MLITGLKNSAVAVLIAVGAFIRVRIKMAANTKVFPVGMSVSFAQNIVICTTAAISKKIRLFSPSKAEFSILMLSASNV